MLFSQRYFAINYTTSDGMPSNAVRSIFKDSRGYLWVGTDAGVCRFNGNHFEIIGSNNDVNGKKVWSITEDGNGNMWFGTYGDGVYHYDGKIFQHFSAETELESDLIRKVKYFPDFDLLLIGGDTCLMIFDGLNFSSLDRSFIWHYYNSKFMDFIQIDSSILIFLYQGEKIVYNPHRGITSLADTSILPAYINKGNASSGLLTSDNRIVFGANRYGIRILNGENYIDFKDLGQVFGLAEDSEGSIWIAAWTETFVSYFQGGLFKYDGKTLTKFNPLIGVEFCMGWTVFYDKENDLLWFGTLDRGLFKIPPPFFEYLRPEYFGVEKMFVNHLYMDQNNNRWIASNKYVIQLSDTGHRLISNKRFANAKVSFQRDNFDSLYQYLVDKERSNLKYAVNDSVNNIYYRHPYSNKKGASLYDPQKYQLLRKEIFNTSYPAAVQNTMNDFEFIQSDSHGNIWISTQPGLFKYDPKQNNLTYIHNIWQEFYITKGDTLLSANRWSVGIALYPDLDNLNRFMWIFNADSIPNYLNTIATNNNKFWYGSMYSGLYFSQNWRFTHINKIDSTLCNVINCITFDQAGNALIGSNDGEIYIMDYEDDSLFFKHRLNDKTGIIGTTINWLICDKENILWVGTNKGLNVIRLDDILANQNADVRFFDHEEGYTDNSTHSPVLDKDGNIWLGSPDGLVKINTNHIKDQIIIKPELEIASIMLHNHHVDWDNTLTINPWTGLPECEVSLHYNQNFISFYYNSLNFLNPGKDRYQYRLKGMMSQWSPWSESSLATFTNLNPGRFVFQIRNANLNTGNESVISNFTFRIYPPWWKTTWFIAIVILFVLLILTLILRIRTSQIRRSEKRKGEIRSQMAELKMEALQSQMNPHFVANAINSIQNYILSNEVDAALTYLSDFSKILRQTLDNARKKYITLEEEIEYLNRYLGLERMRFENRFNVDIQVDDNLDPQTILLTPMLLQPYVENAIKHGLLRQKKKGRLKISFEPIAGEKLFCIVEDDGIGRERSNELNKKRTYHKSTGLKLAEDRIRLLKESNNSADYQVRIIDLKDTKGQPTGTRVELILPLIFC